MSEYLGTYCPMRITGTTDEEKKTQFIDTRHAANPGKGAYTPAEDRQIIDLAKTKSFTQIAEIIGRSRSSVALRYDLLHRDGRAPKKPFVYNKRRA